MDSTTSMHVAGLVIHAPVNAATNLLLMLQCVAYYRHLRRGGEERALCWSLFFQMMAIATAAGVVKHALRPMLGAGSFTMVLAISNVASGFSTHSAQRATIASFAAPARRSMLEILVGFELAVFLAANMALGPDIKLLIVNTAIGLAPVIAVEARAFRRGWMPGGAIAGGLSLSILAGLAYLGGVSPSPWFNDIDVAHLFMGISFELVRRGAIGVPTTPSVRATFSTPTPIPPRREELPWLV